MDVSSSYSAESEDMIINGINIMRLPSRDAYSLGLLLMDTLFTKEELGTSLLFKSKKSCKPGLDGKRVQQMLNLIEKRYKADTWDLKTLTAKANQKCRDIGMKLADANASLSADIDEES